MQYKHQVSIIFILSLFMELLDGAIVHVAVPTLQNHFAASTSAVQWVATAYLLAIGVCVPASAWASDRFGAKRVFVLALWCFALGSLCCALAQSLPQLIAARVLQGVGGGMMSPVGSTLLMRAYPVSERAKAAGIAMVPSLVAPAVAPWVGGYLVQFHSWRWIFFLNMPCIIAAMLAAYVWLRRDDDAVARSSAPLDVRGLLASGCGLALLFYVLSQIAQYGGADMNLALLGMVALGLLAWAVWWFLTCATPLLDMRLFTDPLYASGASLQFLLIAGLCSTLFAVALCQQAALGKSPLAAGAISSAQAVGIMAAVLWAGRFRDSASRWTCISWGLSVYALATGAMSFPAVLGHTPMLVAALILRGAGLGCCLSLTWVEAFTTVPARKMSQASALINVLIHLGNASGVALSAAYLTWSQGAAQAPSLRAFGATFAGITGVAVLSWGVAQFTSQRLGTAEARLS